MPRSKKKGAASKSGELKSAPPETMAHQTLTPSNEPFPPEILERLASEESTQRSLVPYRSVIRILRNEKKFTFREIAEWLSNYNVEADHNTVYREYTKGMSDAEANMEAVADTEAEREEA